MKNIVIIFMTLAVSILASCNNGRGAASHPESTEIKVTNDGTTESCKIRASTYRANYAGCGTFFSANILDDRGTKISGAAECILFIHCADTPDELKEGQDITASDFAYYNYHYTKMYASNKRGKITVLKKSADKITLKFHNISFTMNPGNEDFALNGTITFHKETIDDQVEEIAESTTEEIDAPTEYPTEKCRYDEEEEEEDYEEGEPCATEDWEPALPEEITNIIDMDYLLFDLWNVNPKEMIVKNPIYLTIVDSKPIKFNQDLEWINPSDIAPAHNRGLDIKLSHNKGLLTQIAYTSTSRSPEARERAEIEGWQQDIEWDGYQPVKISYKAFEQPTTVYDLIYDDNHRLSRVNTIQTDLGGDSGEIIVYKLLDTRLDDNRNWIERRWSRRTETFDDNAKSYKYLKPEFHGKRHRITRVDITTVTETRTIQYYPKWEPEADPEKVLSAEDLQIVREER